jgi:mRNA-degrading endonuclease RelE of RelBE toxin-antitoxin system
VKILKRILKELKDLQKKILKELKDLQKDPPALFSAGSFSLLKLSIFF